MFSIVLSQAEEKIACQLAAQQVMHEQQLATAHAAAEQHVQETVADWQQRCRAEQEAAHAMKMDELAQLSRSQAAAMAQCQDRHAEEVKSSVCVAAAYTSSQKRWYHNFTTSLCRMCISHKG